MIESGASNFAAKNCQKLSHARYHKPLSSWVTSAYTVASANTQADWNRLNELSRSYREFILLSLDDSVDQFSESVRYDQSILDLSGYYDESWWVEVWFLWVSYLFGEKNEDQQFRSSHVLDT